MQNCLHSRFRRKTLCLVLALFVPLSVVLLANLAVSLNSDALENVKYLTAQGVENVPSRVGTKTQEHEKMNNDLVQVAKNGTNEEETYIFPEEYALNVNVLMKDGSVKEMDLEEYVRGCVLGEMPVSFGSQALMAQSVAVRTYTFRQMTVKSKHKNADVCTNPSCCQNFADIDSKKMSDENKKKICDAAAATKGVVMMYDGVPINAVYHASSGDKTLSSEEVWGGRLDYLVSVDAPDGEKEIYSHGYGHRVGMSQHGANLLATQGKNYMEILKYYYSGISFSFI